MLSVSAMKNIISPYYRFGMNSFYFRTFIVHVEQNKINVASEILDIFCKTSNTDMHAINVLYGNKFNKNNFLEQFKKINSCTYVSF